jgi:hypothetical protein
LLDIQNMNMESEGLKSLWGMLPLVGENCWRLILEYLMPSFSKLKTGEAKTIIKKAGGRVVVGNVSHVLGKALDDSHLKFELISRVQKVADVAGADANEAPYDGIFGSFFIEMIAQCKVNGHHHEYSNDKLQFKEKDQVEFTGEIECVIDKKFVFEGKRPSENLRKHLDQFEAEIYACAKKSKKENRGGLSYGILTNFKKVIFGWADASKDSIVVSIDKTDRDFEMADELPQFILHYFCERINDYLISEDDDFQGENVEAELLREQNLQLEKDNLQLITDMQELRSKLENEKEELRSKLENEKKELRSEKKELRSKLENENMDLRRKNLKFKMEIDKLKRQISRSAEDEESPLKVEQRPKRRAPEKAEAAEVTDERSSKKRKFESSPSNIEESEEEYEIKKPSRSRMQRCCRCTTGKCTSCTCADYPSRFCDSSCRASCQNQKREHMEADFE